MLVRDLINMLTASDSDAEVMVALLQEDGLTEVFDIEDVSYVNRVVYIEISEVTE